ncbi:PH domain-containing protein [Planosporangium thailandense]|uniref:PH domain-containing protein n=1 Tax=Planosporangium thailandense TaxID=765197 RepID=A0ABX0XTR6_9ACTN|nr:PH domain-containing protein [Planosporangium thailandense]NJC69375.1 PH domain-containing protein [Planosporangium thailandense]
MTTPEPPDGEDPGRRWEDQETEQFARPLDDPSEAAGGGDPGVTAGGAYYVVDEPLPLTDEELAALRGEPLAPPLVPSRRVLPLEEEPSSIVQRYLFPTEKYRGEWRRHWIELIREILIGVAATLLMGYATGYMAKHNISSGVTIVILLWLAILVALGWRAADWWYDRFILTNKRVMLVNGIVTRKVAMMPLLRVTDMKYVQSPLGRLLNYGTFELESAGQEQALRKVDNLPNPNELYLRIVEEMYEPEAVEARLGRISEGEFDEDDGT